MPLLAECLSKYSSCLHTVSDGEAAITAAEEAVSIYRNLSMAEPQVFNGLLAISLTDM
jgi:hypothetical protein